MPDAAEARTSVPQFAVVNAAELLERLAYYGIVAVNTLYLQSLGHPAGTIGLLTAILLPLPYIVPLLTGAVAEKAGYKPMMLAAFVAYAGGFLLLASSSGLPLLVTGIVLLGVGAGMFKPLAAASVAHLTSPKDRSLGYNLYYMGVNVGGFLGPVLISLLAGDYRLAFLVGAAIMALDFLIILLAFRNPVPPQPQTRLLRSFRPLLDVLADRPFLLLLAIFSGFWFLYSMNFSFLTLYLDRFVAHPGWFRPELQQAIDPAFVVLLGLPLGRLAARRDPVRMMAAGIALSVAGFALLGLAASFPALVAGIIVSTAGEVLAYPGFLSYVSRIAPRDRVAVYQGYGFLPLFAGFLLGPIVGGALYGRLAEGAGRPALFWTLMCVVPLLSVAALLLYARAQAPRGERRRSGAAAAGIALLLIPALVAAGAAAGPAAAFGGREPAEPGPIDLGRWTGNATEGAAVEQDVPVPAGATGDVTLEFTWSDAAPEAPPGATNGPDSFRVAVRDALGGRASQEGANPFGGAGVLTLKVPLREGGGALTVTITLTSAGDVNLGPVAVVPDTSADWALAASLGPAGS